MKLSAAWVAGTLALFGWQAATAADADAETRAAARRVAITTCATCHGHQGRSISPKFPRLAGQQVGYFVAQINAFKSRTRGDPDALGYMWGIASPLDDALIAGLAEYYSAQRPATGTPADPAAMARGRQIYTNGVATEGIPPCAACHGLDAAGMGEMPRLAGQSAQYILKQLGAYQNSMRDVAIMHGVASGLHLAEMSDLAAYLNSVGP